MGGNSSTAAKYQAPTSKQTEPQKKLQHGSVADIHVKIIEAKELLSDAGVPTAVVCVSLSGQPNTEHMTKPAANTQSPQWDEHFILPSESHDATLHVQVNDVGHSNSSLGVYDIQISDIQPKNEPKEVWAPLTKGQLHLQITFVEAALATEFEGFGKTKFFANVVASRKDPSNVDLARDYIIIVDKSGSMACDNKWRDASIALQQLAPWVCGADPDGITLYLFSSNWSKHENITDATKVQNIFKKNSPDGSTDLASVLNAAFQEHFSGTRRRTTILCITDGSPDSTAGVVDSIKRAAGKVTCEEELSLTFVQIGNDSGAHQFLKMLDDDLGTSFDIVDTLTCDEMRGMRFDEFISKSLYD